MWIVILCAGVVFGLPLVLAVSARLIVTGASEFRARVLETVAAAVRRGVAVEPQFLWLLSHDVRGRRRRAVRHAASELDAGSSLAASLATALRLPPGDVAAIAAAEGTPQLDAALRATAEADRQRWRLRHELLLRLAYPALILTFLGGFLGLGVAPKFREVCDSMDVSVGGFLVAFDIARVTGLALAALALLVVLSGLGLLRPLLSRLRALRRTATAGHAAAWLRTLSAAVRAGRPLDVAFERSAPAIGDERHAREIRMAATRLREGADVVSTWSTLPLPRWLLARAPLLAGPTEFVAGALSDLATTSAERSRAARERALLVIAPLLLAITGLLLGNVFHELFAMLQRVRETTLW